MLSDIWQLPIEGTHFWDFRLSLRGSMLAIVFCALVAHSIFKRWEPMRLSIVFPLLVLVPVTLSTLLMSHFSTISAIFLAFSTYLGTLVTSIVIYRISPFHPLSRYPGPLSAKISKLWHVWIVSRGKQHLYLQRLHEKYGDIVRIGPNEVCVRDASCIVPMMGATGLTKGPSWSGRNLHPEIPALIAYRDPVEHARRRKPWNRAFNTTSLREFQPIIVNRVHQLVESLGERKGEVVDLAEWISFFTYDFMGDMVFGGWTNMMHNGADKDGLWHLMKKGLDSAVLYEHAPWISYYGKLLPWVGKDLKTMRAIGFARTEQRYKQGSTTRDLFYYLSNEDNAEKVSPPRHLVISDGVLALIAGSDTTATVLSNTFWCLIRHSEAYKRLQAEVDKFYPPGEDSLDGRHLNEMPYLEAVINEGMRLYPAIMSGSQRSPEIGKGGKVVGPYFIPEGNQARMHIWSVHRDARNFSHPNSFWPDRWLIAEGLQQSSEKITHNLNAFIPFSFGPSNCVGKNLAMQEMRMLFCHFMQKLKARFPDGYAPQDWEDRLQDKFITKVSRLPVVIERRD